MSKESIPFNPLLDRHFDTDPSYDLVTPELRNQTLGLVLGGLKEILKVNDTEPEGILLTPVAYRDKPTVNRTSPPVAYQPPRGNPQRIRLAATSPRFLDEINAYTDQWAALHIQALQQWLPGSELEIYRNVAILNSEEFLVSRGPAKRDILQNGTAGDLVNFIAACEHIKQNVQ
jgi:hypothetical protein